MLLFDIETNGLLDEAPAKGGKGFIPPLSRVHCICIYDTNEKTYERYRRNGTADNLHIALDRLQSAEEIGGHNVLSFDVPALARVFPGFEPGGRVVDTLILSRLLHSGLKEEDWPRFRRGTLPAGCVGSHSLRAWGYRLGIMKGKYAEQFDGEDCWDTWSQEMEDYCEQDVRVTAALLSRFKDEGISEQASEIEHVFRKNMDDMERAGVGFDETKGDTLENTLRTEMEQLRDYLVAAFGSWIEKRPPFIPKVNNKARGYVKGVPVNRDVEVTFEPKRSHITKMMLERYGWKPTKFTEGGEPVCDESSLSTIKNAPEIPSILRYLMLQKRLGQLVGGDTQATKAVPLMKLVKGGRIYGRINTIGTVTHRCSHSRPNLGQIPRVGNPFGKEFRELFVPRPGWKMVGCDGEGIQMRMLAHYLYPYDGGAMSETILNGKKEDGTDIHSLNQKRFGVATRDLAKTCGYASLFGAGADHMGEIVEGTKADGQRIIDNIMNNLPGFKELVDSLQSIGMRRGYIFSLDRRRIPVYSKHTCLANLLQGAEAVAVKLAGNLAHKTLKYHGLIKGRDYNTVLCVHDEYQNEATPECAETVGEVFATSFGEASDVLKLRCRLSGEYKIGNNWAETH